MPTKSTSNYISIPRKGRAQTTLDLGEDRPQPSPEIRGGQYSVAVQRAPESNLTKLADALGNMNVGALRFYQSRKAQKEQELDALLNTLTPEQAKLALAGNTEELQASFEKAGAKLDDAQRRGIISFSENPQSYIRGARIAGERVASLFDIEVMRNMEKLVAENPEKDPDEVLGQLRDRVISENGIEGYALEGFLGRTNSRMPEYSVKLGLLIDEQAEAKNRADLVVTLADNVIAGNIETAKEVYQKGTTAMTATKQASLFSDVVNQLLAKEDPEAARRFVASLHDEENNPWTTGRNAPLKDELIAPLESAIDAWEEKEEDAEYRRINRMKSNNLRLLEQSALLVQNGKDPEELVFETSLGNMTIPSPPIAGMTATEYYDHVLESLDTEVMNDIKPDERMSIVSSITELRNNEATANVAFLSNVGYDTLVSSVSDSINAKDEIGLSVYGLDEDQGADLLASVTDELRAKLIQLRSDGSVPADEKVQKANALIREAKLSAQERLTERPQEEYRAAQEQSVLNTFGLGSSTNFLERTMRQIVAQESGDLRVSDETLKIIEPEVVSFADALRGEVLELWRRERYPSEVNLNKEQFKNARFDEIEKHIFRRELLFQEQLRNRDEEKSRGVLISDDPDRRAAMQKALRKQLGLIESGRSTTSVRVFENGQHVRKRVNKKEALAYRATNKLSHYYAGDAPLMPSDDAQAVAGEAANRWFHMETAERLLLDPEAKTPAISLDELRSGVIGNTAKINVDEIDFGDVPILSFDMILNVQDNEAAIYEYAAVLGINVSDEAAVNSFINKQALLFVRRYGLDLTEELYGKVQPPPEPTEEGIKIPEGSKTVTLD